MSRSTTIENAITARSAIPSLWPKQHAREDRVRYLLETTNAIPWEADAQSWRFTYVGPQASRLLGYPIERWFEADFWVSHIHPDDRETAVEFCAQSSSRCSDYEFEYRMVKADGSIAWIHDIVSVVSDDGEPQTLRGFMIDVTDRTRSTMLLRGQNRVLQLLAQGKKLGSVLDELAKIIESQHPPGVLCSILLLDPQNNVLRHGAAPSLPDEYNLAIDGVKIGPKVGSCGTAAYKREQVIVTDTLTDPLWADFRSLAQRFHLRACWSVPILSESHQVLGTFAIYHRRPYNPDKSDIELIKHAAYLAGIAIEYFNSHQILREFSGRLIAAQEEERKRVARELHDDLTQRLAALAIEAGNIERQINPDNRLICDQVRQIRDRLIAISSDVHGISRRLHPSLLDDLGLVQALRSECKLFVDREQIEVDFVHDKIPQALPQDVSLCLYRITQESLRNVAKHAQSMRAQVRISTKQNLIQLIIEDYGKGFDLRKIKPGSGLGLSSMRERARLCHGDLKVHSTIGQGTTVHAQIPMGNTRG